MTEEPPTEDQLKSILEYVGPKEVGSLVKGAKNEADAMKKFKQAPDNFQRPVVCHSAHLWRDKGLTQHRRLIGVMAELSLERTSRRF